MANMEETQDADLDAILGELCALDSEYDEEISRVSSSKYTATGKKLVQLCYFVNIIYFFTIQFLSCQII